jgi:hypothetical protein
MQRIRAFWQRGWVGKLVVGGTALIGGLLLCCVVLVIIGLRNPQPATGTQPSTTTIVIATATIAPSTPTPIPTIVPTNTPEPPTAAPSPTTAPTSTPEATSTPDPPTAVPATAAPFLSAEERAAVLAIGKEITEIGDALNKIGTLAQNYKNTDDWTIAMAGQVVRVQLAHQAITKLTVPPKIKKLQSAILNATTDCNAAMDKLISGLDANDVGKISQASTLMQSCGAKIHDAQPELDALLAQR